MTTAMLTLTSAPTRCTGHCCRDFTLPYSPQELLDGYKRWQSSGSSREQIAMGAQSQPEMRYPMDIHLVAPMVIPLGRYYDKPEVFVLPLEEAQQARFTHDDGAPYHYTCKHFDPATDNCTIYEIRPQVCRDYPYERSCNYAACTWKERKQQPLGAEQRPEGLVKIGRGLCASALSSLDKVLEGAIE